MRKVKYRCKSCGWHKTLPAEWADVKPRFCPTPTCEMSVKKSKGKQSFRNNPDKLETTFIEPHVHVRQDVTHTTVEHTESRPVKEEGKDGKGRSKAKGSEG